MRLAELRWDGVSDRVGDVDDGGALLDDRLDHAAEVVQIRARRILGGKLHVLAQGLGITHRLSGILQDGIPGFLQLIL